MAMITVACPSCGKTGKMADKFVNARVRCPQCRAPFNATPAPNHSADHVAAAPPAVAKPIEKPRLPAVRQDVVEVVEVRLAEDRKACPFCGEKIAASAKICKHCGEAIDPLLRAAEEAKRQAERRDRGAIAHTEVIINERPQRTFIGWHIFHLVMTICTCGLWGVVWSIHWIVWLSWK